MDEACGCGTAGACPHADAGYPWCRACQTHHREGFQTVCPGVTPDGEEADGEIGGPLGRAIDSRDWLTSDGCRAVTTLALPGAGRED